MTPSLPFSSSTGHRYATTHPCLLLPYIPLPSAHIDAVSGGDPIHFCVRDITKNHHLTSVALKLLGFITCYDLKK
jgi:hypothetical protein